MSVSWGVDLPKFPGGLQLGLRGLQLPPHGLRAPGLHGRDAEPEETGDRGQSWAAVVLMGSGRLIIGPGGSRATESEGAVREARVNSSQAMFEACSAHNSVVSYSEHVTIKRIETYCLRVQSNRLMSPTHQCHSPSGTMHRQEVCCELQLNKNKRVQGARLFGAHFSNVSLVQKLQISETAIKK